MITSCPDFHGVFTLFIRFSIWRTNAAGTSRRPILTLTPTRRKLWEPPRGTVSYAYGNSDWKDLLTNYNGEEHDITYDAIENPLFYRKGTNGQQTQFTWEGRQLKTAVANGKNVSYPMSFRFFYCDAVLRAKVVQHFYNISGRFSRFHANDGQKESAPDCRKTAI
ncbi:hypothetical protein [Caproicibacter sp.]|uniref:hypothetical protein n=1 Tax=Caproicibacter sp. TaxID=2814884 RepID=UPI00398A0B77